MEFKQEIINGNLVVSYLDEVIFTIPKNGKDLARVTIEIKAKNKYTANDIYVLRKNMIKNVLGVDSSVEEIEKTNTNSNTKKL